MIFGLPLIGGLLYLFDCVLLGSVWGILVKLKPQKGGNGAK